MTTTFKYLCHSSYCPFHFVYFVFPIPLSIPSPSRNLYCFFPFIFLLFPPLSRSFNFPSTSPLIFLSPHIFPFSLLLSSLSLSSCLPLLLPFFSSSLSFLPLSFYIYIPLLSSFLAFSKTSFLSSLD